MIKLQYIWCMPGGLQVSTLTVSHLELAQVEYRMHLKETIGYDSRLIFRLIRLCAVVPSCVAGCAQKFLYSSWLCFSRPFAINMKPISLLKDQIKLIREVKLL